MQAAAESLLLCNFCLEEKPTKKFYEYKKGSGKFRPKCRDCTRAYYENNREIRKAYQRQYSAKNPEKVKSCQQQRRARMFTNGPVEKIDYAKVWARDHGRCRICMVPVDRDDWHLDHIIPIKYGGTETFDNVQITHPKCNMMKGVTFMEDLDPVKIELLAEYYEERVSR